MKRPVIAIPMGDPAEEAIRLAAQYAPTYKMV